MFSILVRKMRSLKAVQEAMGHTSNQYEHASDNDLIRILKGGDHGAYTELYNRYHALLISFAYKKLQDEDLTKDVIQDVFLKLWVRRESLHRIANVPGYLITSLRNSIFNIFQHTKVAEKYIKSLVDFTNSGALGHTDFLTREREWKKHIDDAIGCLPRKMRDVYLLNLEDHLSYSQIAERLNTTENNVQKHINGARKILRARLTSLFI